MTAMRFKTEKEGFLFYNRYAKEKGFSVRKNYIRRDPITVAVTHRQYQCSREGHRKEVYMEAANRSREPKALTRCGCNALFEIKLDKKKGDWFVVKYVAKHNHPLAKSDEVAFLRSHRTISNAQKANILELKEVGLRQHQVMDVMERHHGGFDATGFVSRDLYNYFTRLRKKHILGGDAERVIKYFQWRQKHDMEFFFEYETDEAGRLKRLFWSDPQSRIDYDAFGDVVVFDSTYRVNRYNLPFIPFVGVNHHGSTIIFGCAIVADEKVATYEWILKQFLDCMYQKHPRALITDGDNAMRRAIAAVMPDSEHWLCTWHIEQNMARHLRPDMLSDFRTLVHAPYDHEEFERKWVEFKVKHKGCEDNQWLVRMYNLRKKWATAYTKGLFFLGMKSNQRSESLNSKLHRYLDRKMSLVLLVEHYEHCLSRMRYREAELDCKASQSIPFTSNDASFIEKDAARIFTPAVFKKLKLVIAKSMDWEVIDCIEEDNLVKYVISMKGDSEMLQILNCTYVESTMKSINCTCRKMDRECLPCEHMVAIMHHLKLDAIPEACIG
ncbi:protein FAR1-RELATED SEQUENCE 5-like [Oryza sativa Japonica Group]|uniref:protein FAR1-RELATED SEQUENCE 5-like n=1 Tax=Oryza sativa subsp. japonica TaxID=39947 RepID=UPI00339CB90D